MIVYFSDRRFNILGHASTSLLKGLKVIDDLKTEDVETGVSALELVISFDEKTRAAVEEYTETGNFLLRSNDDEKDFFTIIDREVDTKAQEVRLYAEDAGLDLLNEIAPAYEASELHTIDFYINKFAYDSGFEIGINEAEDLLRKLKWDDEETVTARLASVASQFDGCEIAFSFETQGLKVTKKLIHVYLERGKNTGVQLRLNRDIDGIVKTESIEDLATALKCKGATPEGKDNPITLSGYDYDDGDFYTAYGVLYSREALEIWTRYHGDEEYLTGQKGHITKPFSYSTTSQETLCKKAISELKKRREIAVNYEADIMRLPDNVQVGDRVSVIDEKGELYLSTRLLVLESSVTQQTQKATLGEFRIKGSGISKKVEELAERFAEVAQTRAEAIAAKLAAEKAQEEAEVAQKVADEAKSSAESAQTQAGTALGKANDALTEAGNALTAAQNAQTTADNAKTAAENARTAVDEVEEAIVQIEQNVTKAETAATNAQKKAEEADVAADAAEQAATKAKADAAAANEAVQVAQSNAEKAVTDAATAKGTAEQAKSEATEAKTTADAAKADAAKATQDILELGESLETVSQTMQADYARKTDLTETEASLQTQISQNAGQIASTASRLQITDETANNAKEMAETAQNTAAAAQQQAATAAQEAEAATAAAEEAQTAAESAQAQADAAKTASETATAKANQAAADLATAEENLATVKGRVDATEEDIAAAEKAVQAAQAAADKANTDATAAATAAANAQTKADNAATAASAAQATANTATTKANNAQTAAANAKTAADEAQEAAEKAQTDATAAGTAAANAQATANAAQTAASNAQSTANTAKTNAAAAQKTADDAATAAANAQSAADDADEKAQQAASDLATAEANLEAVKNRVDATEEDIEAAEQAVANAQQAAEQAQTDAQNAQSAADLAKADAATAKTAADTAQRAADDAQDAADAAQAKANEAKAAADSLAVRVTSAETKINQNSEAIALRATKTEVENIKIGGRNLLKNTDVLYTRTNAATATSAKSASFVDGYDLQQLIGKTVVFSYLQHTPGTRDGSLSTDTSTNKRFGMHGTVRWKDSTGAKADKTSYPFTSFLTTTSNNKRVEEKFDLTPPAGYDTISSFTFAIQMFSKPAADNAETWLLGYPKLEIGTKATDWTPAPEDQKTATQAVADNLANNYYTKTQADAQIQIKADGITSEVSKTYLSKDDASKNYSTKTEVTQTASGLEVKIENAQSKADSAKTTADAAKKQLYHSAGGTSGTAGYVGICQLKVTGAYANRPIIFGLSDRGKVSSNVSLQFANKNNTDPELSHLQYDGAINVWAYKTGTSTWVLIAKKSEAYDTIYVDDFTNNNAGVTVTWTNTMYTALPTTNITEGTLLAGKITKATVDAAATTATNFLSYDGTNGLLIGNKSNGSWSGYRAQVLPTAFNIVDESGKVLASYGSHLIELGKDDTSARISLCGGVGSIYSEQNDYDATFLILESRSFISIGADEGVFINSNFDDGNAMSRVTVSGEAALHYEDGSTEAHGSYVIETERNGNNISEYCELRLENGRIWIKAINDDTQVDVTINHDENAVNVEGGLMVYNNPVLLATKGDTSYYGMLTPEGSETGWIRTTSSGLIPYANGSGSIGSSSWQFLNGYFQNLYKGGKAVATTDHTHAWTTVTPTAGTDIVFTTQYCAYSSSLDLATLRIYVKYTPSAAVTSGTKITVAKLSGAIVPGYANALTVYAGSTNTRRWMAVIEATGNISVRPNSALTAGTEYEFIIGGTYPVVC